MNQVKENPYDDCRCGSGMKPYWVLDARHIQVWPMVCDDCREDRLKHYRPEIFTDPNYEADEEIG